MPAFTLDDLFQLLDSNLDRDIHVDIPLDSSISGVSFDRLGFDSLTLFNTATHIGARVGAEFTFDEVMSAATPNALVELVNAKQS